jgi:hypothetical protein
LADAGKKPDFWTSPSQTWINRIAVVAGLEIANGKKPSARKIMIPMTMSPFSVLIKSVDLKTNSQAYAGSFLTSEQINEALKH